MRGQRFTHFATHATQMRDDKLVVVAPYQDIGGHPSRTEIET